LFYGYIAINILENRYFKKPIEVVKSNLLRYGGVRKVDEKIFNVFFREKPVMMLVKLKNAKSEVYASSLAKQIDCTYSHVVKILQEMEKSGLVQFKKEGRLKLLNLTNKGSEIAEHIEQIRHRL